MKWKVVLAVLLLLGVLGLFFISDFGKQYLGTFGEGLGGLTGYVFKPKQAGQSFDITLTTTKDAFFTQKYTLSGSSLEVTGTYSSISIGSEVFESKNGKSITLVIRGITGSAEFTNGGSILLSGTSTYVEIGDIIATNNKAMKINIEIIPTTATLSGFNQSSIKFASITGQLDLYGGDNPRSATLSNSKLDIENFAGSLNIGDTGAVLTGSALTAKGDNFSFV